MPVALVVDDDPDIRGVIVFMLARAGFEVREESDGDAGFKLALDLNPDIVLLDWMMPRMSGVEVCRAIRLEPSLSSVAITLLTARAQEANVQEGFDAGADDYIVKPFNPRDLIDRVQNLLARRASVARVSLDEDQSKSRSTYTTWQVETGSIKNGGWPA
jgi:DNA-binding response OmpR family regulator